MGLDTRVLSRVLVEAHGGEIGVENSPEEGIFTLTLPTVGCSENNVDTFARYF